MKPMRRKKNTITLPCTPEQFAIITQYCEQHEITKANLLRQQLDLLMPGEWPLEEQGKRKDLMEKED